MWILFAFGSALFAGLTAVLAKIGIRRTDSNLATALRTVVVLAFAWLMVAITGAGAGIREISTRTALFLGLSGLATGASWLCYFRALSLGDVGRVTPIDKSSTVLTMLLAALILSEPLGWREVLAMALILGGTLLMITRRPAAGAVKSRAWLFYAIASAVFAALTGILGKIGIEGVDSTLGTALRTVVVLVFAWLMVFLTGKQHEIRAIDARSWVFLLLSGVTTGASWLCYYRALQTGPASVVVPIDKLSIVLTVAFARVFLGEKQPPKALAGLLLIVVGTLSLLL